MAIYQYTALTPAGKVKKGIIDADTPRDARSKLRQGHFHVTEMKEVGDRVDRKKAALVKKTSVGGLSLELKLPRFQRRIKARDLAAFTRQFSTLLKSGIQLADALNALVEQATDRDLEKVLRNVKEEITGGANLAESLARHPRYFSDLYVNMVRAGEASGNLDVVLTRIANYLQKQASLKGRVAAAVTYPC